MSAAGDDPPKSSVPSLPAFTKTVDRLKKLSEVEYNLCRIQEAKALGVRVTLLDKYVGASSQATARVDGGGDDGAPSDAGNNGANAPNAVLTELNNRYLVVNDAGRALVLAPREDAVLKRRCYDRITFRDLIQLYLNRTVVGCRDQNGNPITLWPSGG
jgi:hypothetical protein